MPHVPFRTVLLPTILAIMMGSIPAQATDIHAGVGVRSVMPPPLATLGMSKDSYEVSVQFAQPLPPQAIVTLQLDGKVLPKVTASQSTTQSGAAQASAAQPGNTQPRAAQSAAPHATDTYTAYAKPTPGTHHLTVLVNSQPVFTSPHTIVKVDTARISGPTRTHTAIAIADTLATLPQPQANPQATDSTPSTSANSTHTSAQANPSTVLLINDESFADAMAATPLAHAKGAPMLITNVATLTPETSAWLTAHAPDHIIIIGGTKAVSSTVEQSLRTSLKATVTRIAGPTRFDTATALANELTTAQPTPDADPSSTPASSESSASTTNPPAGGTDDSAQANTPAKPIVVLDGTDWHTGLPGTAYAAHLGAAVVYTDGATMPSTTQSVLDKQAAELIVIGPKAAKAVQAHGSLDEHVTAWIGKHDARTVSTELARRFAVTSSSQAPSGSSTTNALPAQPSKQTILVMTSANPMDALVAGPLAARLGPLMLMDPLTREYLTRLDAHGQPVVQALRVIGGTKAVSPIDLDNLLSARQPDTTIMPITLTPVPDGIALSSDKALSNVAMSIVDPQTHALIPGTWMATSADEHANQATPPVGMYRLASAHGLHGQPVEVRYVAALEGGGHVHGGGVVALAGPPAPVRDANGFRVAQGTSGIIGTSGPIRTFSVAVHPALPEDVNEFARAVQATLFDRRSWTGNGAVRLQKIGDSSKANVQVVLAPPSVVDTYCARAGLRTGGRVSCWNGRQAMINVERWRKSVPHIPDLALYRQYVINHEVGHGLGHHHVHCARPQALAPVMQQQTLRLEGCRPNAWPFPGQ